MGSGLARPRLSRVEERLTVVLASSLVGSPVCARRLMLDGVESQTMKIVRLVVVEQRGREVYPLMESSFGSNPHPSYRYLYTAGVPSPHR